MGLFGWIRGRGRSAEDARLGAWRREWLATTAAPDGPRLAALAAALDGLGLPAEDVEIEREMLEGLQQLVALRDGVSSGSLPTVATGHRVVGADLCHFSAPASMPDDAAQPSGRLILSSARAIFVGGARATTLPWHAVAEAAHAERDVVLVRHDRETFLRFRCNSYADALCAAFLARHLTASRRTRHV